MKVIGDTLVHIAPLRHGALLHGSISTRLWNSKTPSTMFNIKLTDFTCVFTYHKFKLSFMTRMT